MERCPAVEIEICIYTQNQFENLLWFSILFDARRHQGLKAERERSVTFDEKRERLEAHTFVKKKCERLDED